MAITGTTSSGLQAFQNAQLRVSDAAEKIANSNDLGSQTEAVVELKQGELQAQAAARVIEAENRTVGSLLDIEV